LKRGICRLQSGATSSDFAIRNLANTVNISEIADLTKISLPLRVDTKADFFKILRNTKFKFILRNFAKNYFAKSQES
jgi:hypothetical protein